MAEEASTAPHSKSPGSDNYKEKNVGRYEPDIYGETLTDVDDDIEEPSMYKTILHNDDYTTMDFVVEILISVFGKSFREAGSIMINVHSKGFGVAGIYPYDIASTKVDIVHDLARKNGFPLKCSMEKE